MIRDIYSSLASQKTSAALVSAVTSSFYPSLILESIECDEQGFDLVFSSDIELNESLLQVLQEEVRRRKSKAVFRSFSMMPAVVLAYAKDTRKQIGPLSEMHQKTLVDVCEVDSFCCLLDGPHVDEKEQLGEIVLVSFSCVKQSKKFEWHIRACSVVHKKEANKIRALQQKAWEMSAKNICEKQKIAVFFEKNILLLPEGMKLYKAMESRLSISDESWIRASFLNMPPSTCDVELLFHLLERKNTLQKCISIDKDVMERIDVSWKKSLRMPLGFLSKHTALVRYCFSGERSLEQSFKQLSSYFQTFSVRVVAKNQACWNSVKKNVEALGSEECIQEEWIKECKDNVFLFFQATLLDGRKITLSSFVIDSVKKKCILELPALSLERWLGFSSEQIGGSLFSFWNNNY
jgi:hypothetical protein